MDENRSDLPSHRGQKKRSTMEFNKQVFSYTKEKSNRSVASHYVVEPKTLREWKKDLELIEATQTRGQRLEGGRRKFKDEVI